MSETIRIAKVCHYTQIHNSLLEDPNLSWQAKGMLAFLLSRKSGWTISSRHLATVSKGGIDQVQRTLRELQTARYIYREQLRDEKGRLGDWVNWIYESPNANDHPKDLTGNGKPDRSKPDHSKPDRINTNQSKTERVKRITISLPLTAEPEKSADAECESIEILEAEFWDKEPKAILTPRKSEPVQTPSFASNPTPREVEIFPSCRTPETTAITATGYLVNTEKRYSPTLSRLELTELTQTLIDTYNTSKPSSWGTCTKPTAFLVKQVNELIRIYSQHSEINEAVESLKNDIGAAFVSLRGDKFYDNKDFGQKTIGFYLDAKNVDRLQKRAQVWYDRPQQAKEQLAHKIANEQINGTPCHLTGKILSGMIRLSTARRFRKYLELPLDNPMRNGLPPLEHLQRYYPELLEG
jgi:hypothetical protein